MRFFLIWLFGSLVVAVIAHAKGRSPLFFFSLSVIFSPVVGGLAVIAISANRRVLEERGLQSGSRRRCACGAVVPSDGKFCPSCQKPLPQVIDADVIP